MCGNVTLTVKQGKHASTTFTLDQNRVWVVGRSSECDLQLPGEGEFLSISRRHCLIAVYGSEVRVRDLRSSNGTFVNGLQIDRMVACPHSMGLPDSPPPTVELSDGDELGLGRMVFAVHIADVGAGVDEGPALAKANPKEEGPGR